MLSFNRLLKVIFIYLSHFRNILALNYKRKFNRFAILLKELNVNNLPSSINLSYQQIYHLFLDILCLQH